MIVAKTVTMVTPSAKVNDVCCQACRVLFIVYTSVTGHIPRQWLMHELFTSTANKDALTPNLTSYPLNVARKIY